MFHLKLATVSLFLQLLMIGSSSALAQTAPKPAAAPSNDRAVWEASQAYVAALNVGDFKSAATFWSAEGEFIDAAGNSVAGRKLVGEDLAKRFADGKPPQLSLTINSTRQITPETATEDGTVEVAGIKGRPALTGLYSVVWVRQQSKWLIHSLRETSGAFTAPEHALSELTWMIGRWQAESPDGIVEADCHWSAEQAFLLREITVSDGGGVKAQVSQRIGLDPTSPRFKSWSFDSAGGMAEAIWEPSDADWVVSSHGTGGDGESTSAHNMYSDIGPDAYTLKSTDAHDGTAAPPPIELRFKRVQSTTSAGVPLSAADENGKAAILNSREWLETQRAFEQWLSIQNTYSPEEVQQMRTDLRARTENMSVVELQGFLADSREKLAILLGQEAQQARLWLAQRLAVEVNLTREQIQQNRPDVINKTPAQLEAWLIQWRQQRTQTQQNQKAFEQGRQVQIQNIEANRRRNEQARAAALNRAGGRTVTPLSAYHAGRADNQNRPAPAPRLIHALAFRF
jgi:ketosteroid isomerase-like protein